MKNHIFRLGINLVITSAVLFAILRQPSAHVGKSDPSLILRTAIANPDKGPLLPQSVIAALKGIKNPATLDEAALKSALLDWIKIEPLKACRFLFRELPAELSLKFIPDLMTALAAFDNGMISACLGQIRTKEELARSWQSIVGCRHALTGKDPLDLALLAPPLSRISPTYLNLILPGKTANEITDLLKNGLPIGWLLQKPMINKTGFLNSDISALAVFQGLDAHLGSRWTKNDLLRLMDSIVGTKDAPAAWKAVFQTDAGARIQPKDLRGNTLPIVVKSGPDAVAQLVSALPADYFGASIRSRMQALVLMDLDATPERSRAFKEALGVPESSAIESAADLYKFEVSVAGAALAGSNIYEPLTKLIDSPAFAKDPEILNAVSDTVFKMTGPERGLEAMINAVHQMPEEKRQLFDSAIIKNLPAEQSKLESTMKTLPEAQRIYLQALIKMQQPSK